MVNINTKKEHSHLHLVSHQNSLTEQKIPIYRSLSIILSSIYQPQYHTYPQSPMWSKNLGMPVKNREVHIVFNTKYFNLHIYKLVLEIYCVHSHYSSIFIKTLKQDILIHFIFLVIYL